MGLLALVPLSLGFWAGREWTSSTRESIQAVAHIADPDVKSGSEERRFQSLKELLALDDAALNSMDPIEVDLAVARSIPECASLDVARYVHTVDQWAEHIRWETDRHHHRFYEDPGGFNNSLAYFKALAMVTVIAQDFGVRYDLEAVAFDDPRDLFVHGVIDQRRGTCASLFVLYMGIAHRLGYPIKAVAVPSHMFCRLEDPKTGERLNIEAAGAGGLADNPDEYYMTWPKEVHPQDVAQGGALKSLTMREFVGHKVASVGDYYWHRNQRPEATAAYALAHQLYPESWGIYSVLADQVMHESERYPWTDVHRVFERTKSMW
jgi:hypothetical protein